MEHTEHYQLSLWDADDRIMREDFNDNNAKIDAALAEKPYVIGTYIGNGKTEEQGGQAINLGFRPRMVYVSCGWTDPGQHTVNSMTVIDGSISEYLVITDSGFWVKEHPQDYILRLNFNGWHYSYIAIR